MGRIFAIVSAVIAGVVIADVLTHPGGVAAASRGIAGVEKPALNALLGKAS